MGIKKLGYSALEMLIVIGMISLLIPAMFALFFSNLRAQSKVLILQEVKRNGDNALGAMTTIIKQYGRSLHSAIPPLSSNEICTNDNPNFNDGRIYIKDVNGNWFSFYVSQNKIASESSQTGSVDLTNDKVSISSFALTCTRTSEFSPPLVSISFIASQSAITDRQDEKSTLNYQTKVKLRTY